jgi:phosphatidate cytidylyltransferase
MLISNPFADPLFLPVLYLAAGLLGGTLFLLLAVVRFDPRRLGASVLFRRWKVWAVIAPVYGLAVLSGQVGVLMLLSLTVLQALREYSRLVGLPPAYERVLLCTGLLAAPAAMLSVEAFYAMPPLLLVLATLQPIMIREPGGVRHLAFAALGWAYIAWLLAHLMLLYKHEVGGAVVLLALGLGTALSDVGAFSVGKLFGRRKLAPRLSPGKTWEGALGNLLGAYVGVGLVGLALPGGLPWALLVGLPVVIGVGALWGDLVESGIKREFGAKDAGGWLPGFGGLLDRVDSLIMVVPLVLYALRLAVGVVPSL